MIKECAFCNKNIVWPDIFNCYYCQKQYCSDHSLAENHKCPKVLAAKYIKGDYIREKGVNISSGRYKVDCKIHGSVTDYFDIEEANQKRIDHISQYTCTSQSVWLREHDEDRKLDKEYVGKARSNIPSTGRDTQTEWLYQALEKSQSIINTHHENETDFFAQCNFRFRFDQETDDAFGYVEGVYPDYVIGIHELFSEPTQEDRRFVIMTIVHELVHVIHNDWTEKQVAGEEYKLANLAGYYDTLQRRDGAYLSRRKNLKDLQDNS